MIRVIKVLAGSKIVINAGHNQGIHKDLGVVILNKTGEDLIDPKTGENYGEFKEYMGRGEIVSVDANTSIVVPKKKEVISTKAKFGFMNWHPRWIDDEWDIITTDCIVEIEKDNDQYKRTIRDELQYIHDRSFRIRLISPQDDKMFEVYKELFAYTIKHFEAPDSHLEYMYNNALWGPEKRIGLPWSKVLEIQEGCYKSEGFPLDHPMRTVMTFYNWNENNIVDAKKFRDLMNIITRFKSFLKQDS